MCYNLYNIEVIMIIDTHMHIYDNKYDEIREDVINEALKMGVGKMIAVGFDYESSVKAIELLVLSLVIVQCLPVLVVAPLPSLIVPVSSI